MDDVIKVDLSGNETNKVDTGGVEQQQETANATQEQKEVPQAQQQEVVEEKVIPTNEYGDYVVNLNPEPEDAVQQVQGETEEGVLRDERVEETSSEEEKPQEEEAIVEPQAHEQPITSKITGEIPQLPEEIVKLYQFMEETGGSLEDFVSLNRNIEDMSDDSLLKEYYKDKYKGRYDDGEIEFLLNKDFSYDEDLDDEDTVMAAKLKRKDALFDAKEYFESRKDKYYTELKSRKFDLSEDPDYAQWKEQQEKASQQQELMKQLQDDFTTKTNNLLSDGFEGFGFKLGDDNVVNVKVDPVKTRELQMNANNIFAKFYDKNGNLEDANGYHKALNAASDPDKLARHFYELGKADGIKTTAKDAKNIDMSPRLDQGSLTTQTGQQFKVVSGNSRQSLGKMTLKDY